MSTSNPVRNISMRSAVDFELKNNGRTLVLKDAFVDPVSGRYQDITIDRRGWSLFGFDLGGGGSFNGITADVAKEIQATYGVVLKTLHSSNAGFAGTSRSTTFTKDTAAWFGRSITSYPFGQKKKDVYIAKEDAARYGFSQMTLHDAVNAGIYNAFSRLSSQSNTEGQPAKDAAALDKMDRKASELQPGSQGGVKRGHGWDARALSKMGRKASGLETNKAEPSFPLARSPSVGENPSTSSVVGYDNASFDERKRRLIEHLENKSSVPFSSFVDNNRERKIDDLKFRTMLDAIRRLAKNPEADDKDARYMRRIFRDWFRAAYHYLYEHSEPGDGYSQILSEVGETIANGKKAKELYWRRHATIFWLTLIDLFSLERIGIESLLDNLSNKTSISSWFW